MSNNSHNKGAEAKEQNRTKGLRISKNVVTKYLGEEKDVIIPEGVTRIGTRAFSMTYVSSIVLPSTLERIDKEAFAFNESIESLIIPANVKEIDVSAFFNAFSWGHDALSIDPGNKSYKYTDHVLYSADGKIIYWADSNHRFGDFIIPASVERISDRAFENCYIETITGNSSMYIGDYAFARCHGLKSARFPEGTRLGWEEIITSNVKDYYIITPSSYISSSHTEAEKEAKLRGYAIAFAEGVTYPEEVEKNTVQYIKSHFKLTKKYFAMPEYKRMVLGKKLLTRDQAEELVNQCEQQGQIDEKAELLDYIDKNYPKETIEKKIDRITSKDQYAPKVIKENWTYKKLPDGNIELTGYKGNEVEVTVPSRVGNATVTSIGGQTFQMKFGGKFPEWRKNCGQNIETIILPDTIRKIGQWAFGSCGKLSHVELNEGLEYIDGAAFAGCKSLKELYIPESCFLEFLSDDAHTRELIIPEYGSDIDRILAGKTITLLCKPGSLAEQYALKRGYTNIKYIEE